MGVFVLFSVIALGVLAAAAVAVSQPIKALPPADLGQLQDGQHVRLVGRAVAGGSVMHAPLSGRPCIYFKFTGDEASPRPRPVCLALERYQNFFLELEDGRAVYVRVAESHARARRPRFELLDARYATHMPQVTLPANEPRMVQLLAMQRINWREVMAYGGRFHCSEFLLPPGRRVSVEGRIREEVDVTDDSGYRGGQTRLVLEPPRRGPMVITDDLERR